MTVLIVTDRYTEAERIAFVGGYQDWLWFSDATVADTFVERCRARGVPITPVVRLGIYRRAE